MEFRKQEKKEHCTICGKRLGWVGDGLTKCKDCLHPEDDCGWGRMETN